MQVYTVHHPPFPAYGSEPVLVPEGFCWPAALFSVLWALWHRLWWTACGLLVVAAALEAALAFSGLDATTELAVALGYAAVVGFHANDWRRAALERAGWRFAAVVAAADEDAARRRYFDLGGDTAEVLPPAPRFSF